MADKCILSSTPDEITKLGAYCLSNSTPLPASIRDVAATTASETGSKSMMACSLVQCHWLMTTTEMLRPKRVLELGTFTGVSTLAFYEATRDSLAEIITVELDKEYASMAERGFGKYVSGGRVELLRMCCADALRLVKGQFDLIYIDADKGGYAGYLRDILDRRLLSSRGVVLVDNALIFGLVVDDSFTSNVPAGRLESFQESAAQLRKFNEFVASDSRITCSLLPAFDGVMCIRWR
ncbi:hypothetical protein FE257_003959 [Aspergillus nanangensis]|uniref:O-methyltransferase n=1 Tax=Aspergillus nanangensis TaxID=2582783 RepID=A0AAD4GW41_ASPNN|nr:hypothetical protein FE257_003959 [Aspergillus nanangensis]